jgi:hypothetical protein
VAPKGWLFSKRSQHHHHYGPQPAGVGPDHLLVPLDELVLGVERRSPGGEALRHHQTGQQGHGEDGGEHDEQADFGLEHLEPDRVEIDRGEPQRVGVEGGERLQRREQDDQYDDDDDDQPPAAVRGRARGPGDFGGGAHE